MTRFESWFAEWVIRRRWWILLFAPLIVALAASGGRLLQFSTDYRVFFSEENPQLQAFENLEATYTKDDNVLFLLAPKDGEVFTRETLAVVEELTDRAWQIPYSIRVDSITNFQHTWSEGDDLMVEDLVTDAASLSDADLQRIRTIALNEPLLVDRLIPRSGRVTAVNVTIQLPDAEKNIAVPKVADYANELRKEILAAHPQIEIYLSGMVIMNNAFPTASKNDMKSLIPLSFALMLILLGLLLRGFSGTFATMLVIFMSILTGMGLGGYLGFPLTPPSSIAPTVILTVAIANSVHVLVSFLHELREGRDKLAALKESLRINLQPVTLTSLTTAIGFLSMNFSEAPPFRHLGNFVAIGVAMSFFLSMTFLPALMTLLPVRAPRGGAANDRPMTRMGEFVVNHRRGLFWGMLALILFTISFLPRNELNDVFVHYFDESIEFRRHADVVDSYLGGLYRVDFSLDSGEAGGISDPDYLRKVDRFAQWLRQQPETVNVMTLTDTMKRLNRNMHGDDPAWYKLPEERDLAAQYLLLYEMSLPYGLDLNNQINVDKSSTRVSITCHILSTKEVLAFEQRARDWLRRNAPELHTVGSSPTIMFAHIGERNIRSMLGGTTVALILISAILVAALRSIKIGLISMIPNLVPAAMGFGLWGLLVGQVGLALSIVTGMTLGIIVDDTVHFLSKYLRARREQGLSSPDAVRYAFASVGTALWITSAVLVVGFLVLATSAFALNAGMGLLTAIVIALALLADFFFLPTLLMKIDTNR
jgi:predicted RND superfamily exporter protein